MAWMLGIFTVEALVALKREAVHAIEDCCSFEADLAASLEQRRFAQFPAHLWGSVVDTKVLIHVYEQS